MKRKFIYKDIHLEKLFWELQWEIRIHTVLYSDVFPMFSFILFWSELKLELEKYIKYTCEYSL